jgi:hypothetical protein
MKIEKIKFSHYYHPINPGEWIGMDIILEEGDDPLAAFAKARSICDSAYAQSNLIAPPEINVIQFDKEAKLTGDLAHDISTAPDLVTVDSYRLIVESDQYKHLKPIFEERRRQIVDKETKDLLRNSDVHCAKMRKQKDEN